MNPPLSRLRRLPPRGTTLVAGAGPATAFWHGLLRGLLIVDTLRGARMGQLA